MNRGENLTKHFVSMQCTVKNTPKQGIAVSPLMTFWWSITIPIRRPKLYLIICSISQCRFAQVVLRYMWVLIWSVGGGLVCCGLIRPTSQPVCTCLAGPQEFYTVERGEGEVGEQVLGCVRNSNIKIINEAKNSCRIGYYMYIHVHSWRIRLQFFILTLFVITRKEE
jgi:hypothetical protein